jgi:hypothetical protein
MFKKTRDSIIREVEMMMSGLFVHHGLYKPTVILHDCFGETCEYRESFDVFEQISRLTKRLEALEKYLEIEYVTTPKIPEAPSKNEYRKIIDKSK